MAKKALEHLILYTITEHNILPITSNCNNHCIFCSHHHNPPEVEVYQLDEVSLDTLKEWAGFLDGKKRIIIGESATRICEGEPFCHPGIMDLLSFLRLKYPQAPIQITTSGTFLNREKIKELSNLGLIELYLSLNSVTKQGRKKLMPGAGSVGPNLLHDLAEFNISYHGSLVAMPWIVGWDDLEETICILDSYQARTIRVFMPGYSRLTPDFLRFPEDFRSKLDAFIRQMRLRINTPLTLEPPVLEDLQGEIAGVLRNSPAQAAGLRTGDIILTVNGENVFSRVEAFRRILADSNPKVLLKRNDVKFETTIIKSPKEASGIVMDYDISFDELQNIEKEISAFKARNPLLFVSQAGRNVLEMGLKKAGLASSLNLITVDNRFFGGSIITAGLLTVSDFKSAWQELAEQKKLPYDLLVLPHKAFDQKGRDLTGSFYWELESLTGLPICLA